MKQVLDVSTGEVKAGMGEAILRSTAIGSCVVIAAYNFKKKIGAMAHVMLPGAAPENSIDKTKYAAGAIEELVKMITPEDSKPCDIEEGCISFTEGDEEERVLWRSEQE